MASFSLASYTTDAGTVGRIRLSTISQGFAGQGTLNATITDPNLFAFASNPGSRRKKQLNARGVVLTRSTGTGDARKVFRTFVPITTQSALTALVVGAAVTSPAGGWSIASKVSEA